MSAPDDDRRAGIRGAAVVLAAPRLAEAEAFFTERLGLRVDAVFPADDPAVVVLSGHGVTLRLERDGTGDPGTLRLACEEPERVAGGATELRAPNGTRVLLVPAEPAPERPPLQPALVVTHAEGGGGWHAGRAGMRYRDLLPDRLGGLFVASHVQIPGGGAVPDYVHYHRVHFQLIHCLAGWVQLVYEDQGPAFVMRAGDCVLQPPRIRHRVLECSPGFEVVEVGSPAAHETLADHHLSLPTAALLPERDFDGQRFHHHRAESCPWRPGPRGFEARETGLGEASRGRVDARVLRSVAGEEPGEWRQAGELSFAFVRRGGLTLACEGRGEERLVRGDAFAVPAGLAHRITERAPQLELFEVRAPAGDA